MSDPGVVVGVSLFLAGWSAGWLLLAMPRSLPRSTSSRSERHPMSIVIPARDEARSLPKLLSALDHQLRAGDELIVVDDHSADDTRSIALAAGATVVEAPELPVGWLGKPHACWRGAQRATTASLVFLDADVRPHDGFLDAVASALDSTPDALVTVQPWHEPPTAGEQLSVLFNIVALMGTGRFTPVGDRSRPPVAFGPVIAARRARYDEVGGHAEPTVRSAHTEDIALARRFGRVELFTGRPFVSFRMYPGGLRELVRGWTRTIATGAAAARRWAGLATVGWVWSLAGGVFLPWPLNFAAFAMSAVQVGVLARHAGRFRWWVGLVYPVALTVFVVVVARSAWRFAFRRPVSWKGRDVAAR